ncbi:RidA family protein [Maribacter sp. ACAM166]|uniref:RidA family protein n=1 Tax=Maribacter sp. ACAM166 TaxID=2508996 RepID=UPI0010FE639F|nr:RidA family protein [Maribacter sp. ACAM166]TLP75654.1 RidA family protein [Maribacter sp. ACAM166]
MKRIMFVFLSFIAFSCADIDRSFDKEVGNTKLTANVKYNPESNLDSLGIVLRDQGTPVANYVHAVRSGNLLFLSGKGPKQASGKNIVGKLGKELSLEEGYAAAREAGINQLSVLKMELGNLNKVKRIVSVHGMVNATSDFKDHSKIINGYSDLMVAVFGENGKHTRAAVGMGSLPGNMAVEVEMIVEVYE